MKVEIHEDKCVGAGQCAALAPGVFDQRDDDGVVIVLDENPRQDLHDNTRRAAAACPALAIVLHD
ncbi:MAG: ferredoxin [Marmoricola sp.]